MRTLAVECFLFGVVPCGYLLAHLWAIAIYAELVPPCIGPEGKSVEFCGWPWVRGLYRSLFQLCRVAECQGILSTTPG